MIASAALDPSEIKKEIYLYVTYVHICKLNLQENFNFFFFWRGTSF